jgi:hypothetical protein
MAGHSRSGPSAAQSLGGAEGMHIDCETFPAASLPSHISWMEFS